MAQIDGAFAMGMGVQGLPPARTVSDPPPAPTASSKHNSLERKPPVPPRPPPAARKARKSMEVPEQDSRHRRQSLGTPGPASPAGSNSPAASRPGSASSRGGSPDLRPKHLDPSETRIFGESASTTHSAMHRFKHEGAERDGVPYYKQGSRSYETVNMLAERQVVKLESAEAFRVVVGSFWRAANLSPDDRMSRTRYLEIHRLICMALAPRLPARDAKRAGLQDWAHDSYGQDTISFDDYCDAMFDLADQWTDSVEIEDYLHFIEMLFLRITRRVAGRAGDVLDDFRRAYCRLTEVHAVTATLLRRESKESRELHGEYERDEAARPPPTPAGPAHRATSDPGPGIIDVTDAPVGLDATSRVLTWYANLQARRKARELERPSTAILAGSTEISEPARKWQLHQKRISLTARLRPIVGSSAEEVEPPQLHSPAESLSGGRAPMPPIGEGGGGRGEGAHEPRAHTLPPPPATLQSVRKKMAAATYGRSWDKIFAKVDRDHSGQLNVDELMALMRRVLRIPPAVLPPVDVFDLHAYLDLDGSGQISISELEAFLNAGSDANQYALGAGAGSHVSGGAAAAHLGAHGAGPAAAGMPSNPRAPLPPPPSMRGRAGGVPAPPRAGAADGGVPGGVGVAAALIGTTAPKPMRDLPEANSAASATLRAAAHGVRSMSAMRTGIGGGMPTQPRLRMAV